MGGTTFLGNEGRGGQHGWALCNLAESSTETRSKHAQPSDAWQHESKEVSTPW